MLSTKDYFFHDKFSSRFLMMHKLNSFASHQIPSFVKLVLFFALKDLETLDDVRIFNYFYFFRFFLGRVAFFHGYKSFFRLGKTTFNIKIQVIASKSDIHKTLFFLSNDVFALVSSSYVSNKLVMKSSVGFIVYYVLRDMNIFVEKKTNVGLFNLKDPLNIHIFVFSTNKLGPKYMLQSFKL